jgi:phosphatidylinositol glycan class B
MPTPVADKPDLGTRARLPFAGALAREIPRAPVGWLVAGGLAIAVLSAWFNRGFLSHDEHFQILEFAWYKLGRAPSNALAWEFREQMRPGLQPFMAAWATRGLEAAGLFTPFVLTFLLRLTSGLLAVWVTIALSMRVLPSIRQPALKVVLLAGSLFLWFLPAVHGHFSSDNWGGLLFFAGLCLLLDAVGDAGTEAGAPDVSSAGVAARDGADVAARGATGIRAYAAAAAAGLLWGLAFYCRYQIGFAIAGAGFWLLFVRRARLALIAMLLAGFVVACVAGAFADRWLYGGWVLTPYEYARANLIEGKAAAFGVKPWWFYGGQILLYLVPPFSLVFVGLLVAGAWYCRRHILVWATLPFLVGHSLIGHKEARFLIPITYAVVPLMVLAADNLPARAATTFAGWARSRAGRYGARVFVVLNLAVLAVMTLKPSSETEIVYRWLWQASEKQPITVYTVTGSPYNIISLDTYFYRAPNVTVKRLETIEDLRAAAAAAPGRVFFFPRSYTPPGWLASSGLDVTPAIRTLPSWVTRVNVNDWVARMNVWTVFAIHAPQVGSPPLSSRVRPSTRSLNRGVRRRSLRRTEGRGYRPVPRLRHRIVAQGIRD